MPYTFVSTAAADAAIADIKDKIEVNHTGAAPLGVFVRQATKEAAAKTELNQLRAIEHADSD